MMTDKKQNPGLFQAVGSGLDKILTLSDLEEEQTMQTPDRVVVGGASYFTSVDQSSVHSSVAGRHQKENLLTSVDFPGSKKTQGEKFFLIHTAEWNQSDALFHEVAKLDVVKLLYDQQFAVDGLLRYHTYARFGIEVQIQINPTTFQQGGLVCAMVPADQGYGSIACLTVYPHGLLNCNINNVVRIKVPFVYTRGAYNLRDPLYKIWELTIRVWNRLYIGTGTTPFTTVNVLARMVDLELHGLTPIFTQMMRNEFRISSTENVINLSNFEDSRAKISLALDQEDWLSDTSEAGGLKIRNFSTWTSIPTLAAQFSFNDSATVGTQIMVIPVDPFYYRMTNTSPSQKCVTSLASIAQMYCFWRGDIVFDFQAFPTKYHSGRLLFCFVPGNETMDVTKITLKQATTGPCAVMDITGVNSTLRFRVPWICDTPYRVNRYTKSSHVKGEYTAIGKIIVFVYNRLANPNNVAGHVYFNVYTSAVNLELFGPVYSVMTNASAQAGDEEGFSSTADTQQNEPDPCGGITNPKQLRGKANQGKLDLAAGQVPKGAVTIIEDPILAKKIPETFPEKKPGVSRHTSDHMDIYRYMGRAHFLGTFTFKSNNKEYTFPISLSSSANPPHGIPSTLRWFFNLFHLYRGPLDLTIVVSGATDVDGLIWFTPVGMASDTPWQEKESALSVDYKTSLGAVRFNTRRTGNIQMRLPWYSYLYAISGALDGEGDKSDSTFGTLSVQITNYTASDEYLTFALYLSLTEQSECLFPRAPLNNNAVMDTPDSHNMMCRIAAGDLESCVDSVGSSDFEDIEQTQSGADIKEFSLVSREEENRIIKGFYFDGKVFRLSESNWFESLVPFKSGCFIQENPDNWGVYQENPLIAPLLKVLTSIEGWNNVKFPYSKMRDPKKFTEFAKKDPVLSKVIEYYSSEDLLEIFYTLKSDELTVVDKLANKSGVKKVTSSADKLIEECRSFLKSIKQGIKQFALSFHSNKYVKWMKFIMDMVKIAIHIYICHKCNWDRKIVLPIVVIMSLEQITKATDLLSEISEIISDRFGDDDEGREHLKTESLGWMRDLVSGITIARTAKDIFIWLWDKLKNFYDRKFGETAKKLKLLKEHEEEIENTLAESDAFCVSLVQEVTKEEQYRKGIDLISSLRTVISLAESDPSLKKHSMPLRDSVQRVHNKIKSLGAINQNVITRPEPVVCYLYGRRGGGKSLTSMALATKICKQYGVDPKKNIYTKPVSSDYWDGYSNQLVCIIDDIGQCTDDEDWSDFCQLVSGCPLRLNMAAIEEKGKHFSSPFIICTSNQDDPSPKTVYVREAIHRRLHFKVKVEPKKYYMLNDMLNVGLAKKDDKIRDMSCVTLSIETSEIDLQSLVNNMVSTIKVRTQNMDEFMDLWSEGWREVKDAVTDEFRQVMNFHRMREATIRKLRDFFKAIKGNKTIIIGGAVGIIGLMIGFYHGFKAIKAIYEEEKEEEEEPVTSGVYHGVKKPKNVIKLDALTPEAQSIVEISGVIHKNLVRFGIGTKGGSVDWLMNGLGVKDEWLLLPSHAYIFEEDLQDKEFYFQRNSTYYSVNSGSVTIKTLDTGFQDVVLMKIPSIPKFKDITHHFIKKSDLEQAENRLATLVTMNSGTFQMVSEGQLKLEEHATYSHKTDTGEIKELTISQAWRGKGMSSAGMCGGGVVSSNSKLQNPIVGIHVAGGKGTMISKVVYREMLENLDLKIENNHRVSKVEFTQSCVNVGSKTLFNKSPIHDYVEPGLINFPAALPFQKTNEIDPIQVMLSKYDVPIAIEPGVYEKSFDYYFEKVQGLPMIIDDQLTIEQAIEGVEGMDPLNMKTSAGLPYILHNLDKELLIWKDDDGKVIGLHPFLKNRIDLNLMCMDAGNQMDVIFMTCPKDELRPLEKVLSSKTRAIEACPLDFTIICRMMWAPAISYFQLNPGFHTGVAVGMDPDPDWDSLFKAMLRFGDYGLDLDFSSFDASLSPFMINYGCLILSELSGLSEGQNRALSHAICYSRHQILNMIYTVEGSMPSGTPCTSLLNSIINNINLIYVFSLVLKKPPNLIFNYLKMICYGDDVLIVFNRKIPIEVLGKLCPKIVKEFAELKMTVTSSTKGLPEVKKISELTFLKREFNLDFPRVKPSISDKTIWSLVSWQRNNAEFEQNLDTAFWFAFLKGQDFYESFTNKIRDLLRMARITKTIPSYQTQNARFLELEFERDMD
ncbi:polyprotein [Bat hepatovirus BUO2BF86Colafr2010]|uniref:Genome polyprotein n=2 Tax=Hepatovirus TaxID=12091 RepID=A0A0S1M3C6_9PICO|nr:polyprotein [Bat hepatovirus BUO2BF86Colafr2010]ALL35273.1 polyprotein [Bat hepatovirus BUO2BF86Colafr2010]